MLGYIGEINYSNILSFIEGLKPTPLLTCSEWADKNRFLPSEAAAEPGRWRTSKTPFLKEILDHLSPTSTYKQIIVQKSVQLGFTESGLNAVGTYIDIAPCPILYIMPTVNMAKGLSKTRVTPMILNCPSLSDKIKPARERDSNNTVLEKSFPGGILVLTGANSAAELRSRPIRVVIMDEIDAYPLNVEEEGSPIELAEKRTVTFSNRKIYKLSTPTKSGASAIEKEIEFTDKRKYFVPLPCCGTQQILEFQNLKWEEGKPDTVKYECPHCGGLVDERFKTKFLAAGQWIATDPDKSSPDIVGYIINGLYSPLGWLSWKDIAREWEKAKNDAIKIRTFTNTVLGISYAEKSEQPAWRNLYNRRENYNFGSVNSEVCFITAGVDVQRDRIELEVVGWCTGKRSYSIEYVVFNGDTSNSQVWSDLTTFISKQFVRDDDAVLPIRMIAIDSGYNTQEVYNFCRKFDPSKIVPIKGQDNQSVMVSRPKDVDITTKDGSKQGTIRLYHIGVSLIKSEFYGWLRLEKDKDIPPPGFCHFPQYSEDYFKGITAEKIELRTKNGINKYQWVKDFDRNEPLDCRIYARAAASLIGLDRLTDEQFETLRNGYPIQSKVKNEVKQTNQRIYKKSDFWDR